MLYEARCLSCSRHNQLRANFLNIASSIAMAGAFAVVVTLTGHAQSPPVTQHTPRPATLPALDRLPDPNKQMEMKKTQTQEQFFTPANAERKRQLDSDSALLLRLAVALKAQVTDADKSPTSSDAFLAIDGIEKLAHAVKEKMKLTVSAK